MIEIRYTITPAEYQEANSLLMKNSGLRRKLTYSFVTWLGPLLGALMVASAVIVSTWAEPDYTSGFVLLVCGLYFLSLPWLCRRMMRRRHRMQRLSTEIILTAGNEGIQIQRANGEAETRYRWPAFQKQVESQAMFVLFPNMLVFLPIPKRAMTSEQQQELRALIAAHLPGSSSPSAAQPAVS
jgi:YcxB-like protein